MRERNLGGEPDPAVAEAVGLTPGAIERMFRLLAIAKYDERYVIPQAHGEVGVNPHSRQGACGLDFEGGPGSCGALQKTKDPSAPSLSRRRAGWRLERRLPRLPEEARERRSCSLCCSCTRTRSCSRRCPSCGRPQRRSRAPSAAPSRACSRGSPRCRWPSCAAPTSRRSTSTGAASLHLTYHTHGDRRQRGLELVRLKRRYAEAGLPFEGGELPDYLPVLLEFASLAAGGGRGAARRVPRAARAGPRPRCTTGRALRGRARRALRRAAAADGPPARGGATARRGRAAGRARRARAVRRGGARGAVR